MVKRLILTFLSLAMFCRSGASELKLNTPPAPGVRSLHHAGLENLFALGTNLFSGGSPEGDEAFASLAKLGVKTIVTVDGAQPDLARAKAHGMRYIHLPHGYDGITRDVQLQLVKAARSVQGPIFIHCHHGKHRGPAAAAVICMSESNWSQAQAEAWLRTAGTDTNYAGLYATVRSFRAPMQCELAATPADLPEARKVSGLVDSMVAIDATFDRLKTLRTAADSARPDNHLLTEATLLREQLRESQRLPDSKDRGASFLKLLSDSENLAKAFEESLTASTEKSAIDRAWKQLAQSCVSCHREHRDSMGHGLKNSSPLGR